ncbi:RodZ domain-containing protein [Isoalcanivorax indicus]|uniref:RodZ domain-containing protein n=1 Tax=Isoalcanivorax indicus TaxID=2202653 RepID=UPI000DB96261|nr:RodZ domain-containing protein [Isoalcanivorax indicus]
MSDELNLPGQRLRAERTRQGLSEQDVAARLHLSMSYLRALEADDYDRLPEAAFVKGYVRNYARMLGLPGEELVAQFKALVREDQRDQLVSPVHTMAPPRRVVWLAPLLALLVVLIVAMGWWLVGADHDAGTDARQPVAQEREVIPPDEEPEVLAGGQGDLPEAQDNPAPELAPGTPVGEPEPVGEPPEVVSPSEPVIDQLAISFSQECWVEVSDAAGERLFQGQRNAGQNLSLRGEAPFRVTLGNAAAVTRMQFNGETMPLPQGNPGRVVRISVP